MAGNLSVKVENQQIIAKACNLKSGTKAVWFFVGKKGYAKNGIGQRENKFENNCAVKTYNNASNDLFLKGGEVFAAYDENGKEPIQTNPETVQIPGQSTPPSGGNPPGNNPPGGNPPGNNPPPVTIPEDPRKEMDPKKVKNYAEQAANFFANRVVDIYGRVENYKYNFYVGFKKAASFYSNLGISVQNLPQYGQGMENGLSQGYNDGYLHGQQKGASDGKYLGRREAINRFSSAVQNENSLNITPGSEPDTTNYSGISPSLGNPDLNAKLIEHNGEYYSEITSEHNFSNEVEFDSDLTNYLYGHRVSLGDYYSWNDYKNEVLFSYWKSENAFSLFLSKRLIKSSSVDYNKVKANNELIAKYREITDPSLYKDAEENKRLYRHTFINQYDDVIGTKWNNEVYGRPNHSAQARGEYYFTKAIQAYARDLGYRNGYIQNYVPRSIQGYKTSIAPAYFQSFNDTVQYYSNNPVIENIQLAIENQDGKNSFAVIDNIIPVLTTAVNLGKVPGKIRVQVQQNQNLNNASNTTLEIEIPGLTRVTSKKQLGVISTVSTNVKPDETVDIVLNTNLGNQTLRLSTPWHQTIHQTAKDTPQRQQILVQYLSQHLGKEMKDMRSVFKKNRYKHEPNTTLAGKFVATYMTLSQEERQILNKFQPAIVMGIGKRPTNFICIGCGKDEWDSAQLIFQQIGWNLPK